MFFFLSRFQASFSCKISTADSGQLLFLCWCRRRFLRCLQPVGILSCTDIISTAVDWRDDFGALSPGRWKRFSPLRAWQKCLEAVALGKGEGMILTGVPQETCIIQIWRSKNYPEKANGFSKSGSKNHVRTKSEFPKIHVDTSEFPPQNDAQIFTKHCLLECLLDTSIFLDLFGPEFGVPGTREHCRNNSNILQQLSPALVVEVSIQPLPRYIGTETGWKGDAFRDPIFESMVEGLIDHV